MEILNDATSVGESIATEAGNNKEYTLFVVGKGCRAHTEGELALGDEVAVFR